MLCEAGGTLDRAGVVSNILLQHLFMSQTRWSHPIGQSSADLANRPLS
jgi:hypothetical protein